MELEYSATSSPCMPRLAGIHGFACVVPQYVRLSSGIVAAGDPGLRARAIEIRQAAPAVAAGLALERHGAKAPELLARLGSYALMKHLLFS